jgi:hypothetical protein
VVPGGGLSSDHERWISCLPGFFLPVEVLSQLFRRLFLEQLEDAFYRKQLLFPGSIEPLRNAFAFADLLRSHEERDWVVYAKPPFGGPQRALEYLGRYTHRVAISNHRLLSLEDGQVTFQWKDYRSEHREKSKTMTIDADEFQRRFLGQWRRYMAVLSGDKSTLSAAFVVDTLPAGFQRIRHYGFLANCHRKDKLELCRALLFVPVTELLPQPAQCTELKEAITEQEDIHRCPHCGIGLMIRIAVLPCYRWPAIPPPDTS